MGNDMAESPSRFLSPVLCPLSSEPLLDTARRYETPEGIALVMRVAGPVVRAWAWAIDLAIRAGVYLLISIPLTYLGGIGTAGILIGFFLIEWFYPVAFELSRGSTPGKRAMGLLVLHDNGTPVTLSSSLIRNLLRAADFLPFFYGAGLVSMLLNRDFKRLGDMAAGTLVVYRDTPVERHPLPSVAPVALPGGFSGEEQQMLLTFAERAARLTQERRVELAEILSGLTGKKGEEGVEMLYAYASWLVRGR
jgi:uncharacterized RDD family membrane protein YckC